MVSRAETGVGQIAAHLGPDSDEWWVVADRMLSGLTAQERDIVRERCSIGGKPQLTLEEIGQVYGLTKERIRQIVAKVPMQLSKFPIVTNAVAALTTALGQAASFMKLSAAGFDPSDPLVGILLEMVRVRRNSKRSWSVYDCCGVQFLTMDRDFDPTMLPMIAFSESDNEGIEVVRDLDAFYMTLASRCRDIVSQSEVPTFMAALLEHCTTLHFVDGVLVRWDGSYVDKAVRVLRVSGHPMPAATLDQIVAPGRERPVTARIQSRDIAGRIIRAAEGGYGLPEWTWMKPYVELEPAMRKAITDSGGKISLRRLRRVVEEEAGFPPASVTIYAQMHPVFVFEDDVVRLREDNEPASTRPIETSPHCYRILEGDGAGEWSFVTALSFSALRAASLIIPGAFGARLGLHPGDRDVTVSTANTKLQASWAMAPYIQSRQLKKLLQAREALDGQILRIIGIGQFKVAIAIDDPVPPESPAVLKIAKLIGLTRFTDIEEVVQGLAQAIGLDGSPSGSDILRRLEERGEPAMRDLLLEVVPELSETER